MQRPAVSFALLRHKPCQSEIFARLSTALAWTLHHPAVTSTIIGPRTLDQLETSLPALDIQLTEEELAAVDALVPPGTVAL